MSESLQVVQVPVEKLTISRFNIRKSVGDISELADSIRQKGILQPIVVRPIGEKFEVIIGARRFTAAKKIGLKTVPAVIRKLSDSDSILESLTENVQRNNLEPKELGEGIVLLKKNGLTENQIGKLIGKSGQTVSDMVRSYELLVKLEEAGKKVDFKPDAEERRTGDTIPFYHTVIAQKAFEHPEVKEAIKDLGPKNIDKKKIELVEKIAPLTHHQAQKVVDEFKKYPNRPLEETKEKALAKDFGVAVHTYLTPSIAREIDELADKRGVATEELIPEVIKKGLSAVGEPREERGEPEYETVKLPVGSLSEQLHNKQVWNLERIDTKGYNFYTIGYSERTSAMLVTLLKKVGVRTLVDVRAQPTSQYRPEFNKKELQQLLKQNGIEYVHYPQLGVSTDVRMGLAKTGDWTSFFEWYDKNVIEKLEKNFVDLESLSYPLAFMCVELDPTKCHRHRIARFLEQKKGLKGLDL